MLPIFYFSIWLKPVSRRRGRSELIKSLHHFKSVQSVQTNHLWFPQQVLINVNLNPKRNHKPNQIQLSPRAIVQIITKSSWLCLRSFEPQIRLLRFLRIKKQPWDQCIRLMTWVNLKKLPDHWTCMIFFKWILEKSLPCITGVFHPSPRALASCGGRGNMGRKSPPKEATSITLVCLSTRPSWQT